MTGTNTSRLRKRRMHCQEIVDLPLERIVSWHGGQHRDALRQAGIDPFDKPIHQTPHYQAIARVDQGSESIVQLDYVKYFNELIRLGKTTRDNGERIGCGLQRLRRFVELYEAIKAGGRIVPIKVSAEMNGCLRVRDGQHRAAIALHLGRTTIPGRIVDVDSEVATLLRSLYRSWPPHQRALYQPVEHPVVADWPTKRADDRWRMMADAVDWKHKKVLDIGSYTGHVTRALQACGAEVIGVEFNHERLQVARQLNRLLGTNVYYQYGDYTSLLAPSQFDVIVMLSVLHWILKDRGQKGFANAIHQLSTSTRILFMDMADSSESKMRTRQWNHGCIITPQSIPQLVLNCSEFENYKRLGVDARGRTLFAFWRGKCELSGPLMRHEDGTESS